MKGVTPGELFDRLTIITLENLMLGDHSKQLAEQREAVKDFKIPHEYLLGLLICNAKIWNLESDIRKGKLGEMSHGDVGRRAIQIRDINTKRWEYKNAINIHLGYPVEAKTEWEYPIKYADDYFAKKLGQPKAVVNGIFNTWLKMILGEKYEVHEGTDNSNL